MAQGSRPPAPLFVWRTALLASDLPPTTKHVLLTLSVHMNELGTSAFPTVTTQAVETGLDGGTVRRHLRSALDLGWIEMLRAGGATGGRRSNEYAARIPGVEGDASSTPCGVPPVDSVDNSGARPVPRAEDALLRASCARSGRAEDAPSTSVNSPANSSVERSSSSTVDKVRSVWRTPLRDPDPACSSCHGSGLVYNAVGGFDVPCRCVWELGYEPPLDRATRPPVGFGLRGGS